MRRWRGRWDVMLLYDGSYELFDCFYDLAVKLVWYILCFSFRIGPSVFDRCKRGRKGNERGEIDIGQVLVSEMILLYQAFMGTRSKIADVIDKRLPPHLLLPIKPPIPSAYLTSS